MKSAEQVKETIENRLDVVRKDLEENFHLYDKPNIALRKLEIMKLESRLTLFN